MKLSHDLFFHFAKVSSHVWKNCSVSHTLCCYTTIIVTIIEAVARFPSAAWTQNTTMHSIAAQSLLTPGPLWFHSLQVKQIYQGPRLSAMFHWEWVYSTTVGSCSCKSQVSTLHTCTGACTVCPTAKSKDDFKELNILVIFTTWTTPFTHC